MSEVKWTNEQLQAIEEKGSNILVAAAAGSGKTAVLVERIIHKIIDEKMDIDKMLVVTFTNAAASEMRERILKAIYEKLEKEPQNVHLQRQITLLNKSSICTIHSFCLDVIHNHFYELDIPSNFRIADTTEIDLLKQEVLDDLFEQKYLEGNTDFLQLLEIYTSYRTDETLQELVLTLYRFIQSSPFPKKWLQTKLEEFKIQDTIQDFGQTIWGKIILQSVKEEIEEAVLQLEAIETKMRYYIELAKFTQVIAEDKIQLQDVLTNISSWDNTCQKINSLCFTKWPVDKKVTNDLKEEAKEIRDGIKKKIKEKVSKKISVSSVNSIHDFQVMEPVLKKLVELVLEFSELFSQKKKEKNCIDFNDIEHFALKILVEEDGRPTSIAKKYQEKFEEIAIDEYQDSNLVQESILTSISRGNNIFMVGDVKQSIYKFRQARPDLFLQKYEEYQLKENKTENDHLKIQLFKNFRSRENILNITNLVFETIMSKELGDILYNENEYLNYGANYPEPEDLKNDNEISGNNHNILQKERNEISENKLQKEKSEIEDNILKTKYAGIAQLEIIDLKEDESITAFKSEETTDTKSIYDSNITAKNETLALESNMSSSAKSNMESLAKEMLQEDDDEERIEDEVLEARFVAKKIQTLLQSDYMVFGKNQGYRPIQPKDIVILLRATSNLAPIYETELADLELPVFSDTSSSYLDSVEIQTILSVLKILDNPLQEIPLVVVLRSTIGNFTDNDLITIRLTDRNCNFYEALLKTRISGEAPLKQKIENLLSKLEKWKTQEKYLPLDELIWQIYLDTGYYQYVGLLPNGAMRQANLKTLFEKAKQYETASYKGLFHFVHFMEKLKKQNGDLASAKLIGENEDVIRIMSIHKSKGLEFPVVFLCNAQKRFNLQDLNDVILLHQELGFGPNLIDAKRKIKYPTLAKEAIGLKMKQETLSEEERILYVALTRAKERLFITARSKDLEKDLKTKKQQLALYLDKKDTYQLDYRLVQKGKSYLDWLLYVYLFYQEKPITLKGISYELKDIMTLHTYRKQDLIKELQQNTQEQMNFRQELQQKLQSFSKEEKEKMQKELKEKLSWKYPYLVDTKLQTKTSVTKIKQEKMKLEELEAVDTQNDVNDIEELEAETTDDIATNGIDDIEETRLQTETQAKQVNFLEIESKGKTDEMLVANQEMTESKLANLIPKFLKPEEKISNSKKGTLVHLCIQKLDEKKDYTLQDIKQMIEQMVLKEIITEKEAQAIDANLVYEYTKSELFQELKQAKEIHKEQPFYISIPAKEIIQEAKLAGSEKSILVQGIIDLYYIDQNDNLKLVDYKTDYVGKTEDAKEKILEKYRVQLEIYQKALEQSLSKKVSKVSLCLANANWECVSVLGRSSKLTICQS